MRHLESSSPWPGMGICQIPALAGLTRRAAPAFWLWLALLVLILALALAVRSYRLGQPLLEPQETFSWRLTRYAVSDMVQRTSVDVHPPLYYLLLKAWTGLWGTSPAALRGLSVLLGVLSVLTASLFCREACLYAAADRPSPPSLRFFCGGAIFCALLMALHPAEVTPARLARMYSLGTLLAALSAWLLLKALRPCTQPYTWWAAYGATLAAFCYTHNYAFLTAAAQGLCLAGLFLTRFVRSGFAQARPLLLGAGLSLVLAVLLYAPWIPVLWSQVEAVQRNYWVPKVTFQGALSVLFTWVTGLDREGTIEMIACLLLQMALLAWVLWQGGAMGWFCALQACVPWFLSLALSLLSGRSIFVDRYLAFAHVAYLALWGVGWCRLSGWGSRLVLVQVVGVPAVLGVYTQLERVTDQPPAISLAVDFLAQHYRAGDVVLAIDPQQLNGLRYYAAQAGLALDIRCPEESQADNHHFSHAVALESRDFLGSGDSTTIKRGRLWRAAGHYLGGTDQATGREVLLEQEFTSGETRYYLVLYGKDQEP